MNTSFWTAAGAVLAFCAAASSGADDHARDIAVHTCSLCHGAKGESTSSAFPRLAGQNLAYLEAQLKAFRSQTRGDPPAQAYMWGMTSQLDDPTIHGLAAYYAAQKPVSGTAGPGKLMEQGREIFEKGLSGKGVVACMTCHGPDANGNEAIPRLAGQHAAYLVKQLAYFKSEIRANNPAMHAAIGTNMSVPEMEAVAAYVASK